MVRDSMKCWSNPNIKLPDRWTPDGRFVVYSELDPKTKWDLWVLPMMDGANERHPLAFLHSEFNELYSQISPDGRWMAYTSDESGRREIYVRRFPEGSGQVRISKGGGEQPRWRRDGKELFFMSADGTLTSVSIKESPYDECTVGQRTNYAGGAQGAARRRERDRKNSSYDPESSRRGRKYSCG